jgi:hypothetical protein
MTVESRLATNPAFRWRQMVTQPFNGSMRSTSSQQDVEVNLFRT